MQHNQEVQKDLIKNILRTTQQTENVASNFNEQLYRQGEKLDSIHDKSKDCTKQINKADKTSKRMTSFWYRVKEKVKNWTHWNGEPENMPPNIEPKENDSLKYSSPEQKKNIQQFEQMTRHDQEVDQGLDQISQKLRNIKRLAKDAGTELDRHNEKTGEITSEVEKNSEKIQKINHRLNKKFM